MSLAKKKYEVISLATTQIAIYEPDAIPYGSLTRQPSVAVIESEFGLTREQPPIAIPGAPEFLVFVNGEFVHDGRPVSIDRLALENRRLVCTVNGGSDLTTDFRELVEKNISKLDNRVVAADLTPAIVTHETKTAVRLPFSCDQFFGHAGVAYLADAAKRNTHTYGAEVEVFPFSVRIRVSYFNIPEGIRRKRISLVDKDIIFEVKNRTDKSDAVFDISTPFSSEDHFQVIDEVISQLTSA